MAEGLTTMPAKRGPAPAGVHIGKGVATLTLTNHGTPLVWRLGLHRYSVVKRELQELAKDFDVAGNAQLNPMAEPFSVSAQPGHPGPNEMVEVAQGQAEFGLLTEDELEYFFSKGSGLTGIVRFKRGKDGETWSAQVAKTFLPRVLSQEAVKNGLMPPLGQSALPQSLESVIPAAFRYWAAETPEQAQQVRDALVETSFLNEDTIKVVDGELRKVEVRYFLFEPEAEEMREVHLRAPRTLADKVLEQCPADSEVWSPLSDGMDAAAIAKGDKAGRVTFLHHPGLTPEQLVDMTKFVVDGHWVIAHDDTPQARETLAQVGPTFKVAGEGVVLATSFAPAKPALIELVTKETGGFGADSAGHFGSGAPMQGPPAEVQKPFGGFADFDACLAAQRRQGKTEESARAICGALQRDTEDNSLSGRDKADVPALKRVVTTKDDATEQRYVFGVVLEPEPFNGEGDAQEDVYDEATIEKAHREFMLRFQNVGLMHKGFVNEKVRILESYIAPVDFTMKAGDGSDVLIKKGTWLMGAKVLDDELWAQVKTGDLTGWSIGGTAVRTPEAA